jgi:hypothetical protein
MIILYIYLNFNQRMIFSINQNELFNLLQSEKFLIGKALIAKTIIIVEKISNRSLKEKVLSKQLLENFKKLRNKWKNLQGGPKRQKFKENNLSNNIVFNIEEKEFDEVLVPSLDSIEPDYFDSFIPQDEIHAASKKRLNISAKKKIQRHLTHSNNFLQKYGLCFKNVKLFDAKVNKYDNSFKLVKN